MKLTFRNIKNEIEISELSALARKIWTVHYPSIIGQKQTDYMIGKNYSTGSLKDQINNKGNIFLGVYLKDRLAGFISYSKSGEDDYFIHKLYVDIDIHGKGLGKALFNYVFGNLEFNTIRLTVNRQNVKAINFYFRIGFTIEKIIDIDIGEGYFMNDFIMLYSHQAE